MDLKKEFDENSKEASELTIFAHNIYSAIKLYSPQDAVEIYNTFIKIVEACPSIEVNDNNKVLSGLSVENNVIKHV